jgi:ABC-type lipoprotein release transport system permease subunit
MQRFVEISKTGLTSVVLHPLRSAVTILSVLAVLLPYLVGLGISKGIQEEADVSVRAGADLYVSGWQLGAKSAVPTSAGQEIARIDGVVEVVPRIVGAIVLGRNRENAVLLGLPTEKFPGGIVCIEGRLPQPGPLLELVVGTELARRLHLTVGAVLPPFYHNDQQGDRLAKVVGVFRSDVSLWQANLILTTLENAATIFGQTNLVTDYLVYCRPGYQSEVRAQILQTIRFKSGPDTVVQPRVVGREELQALFPQGLLHREGIFNLHFTLAFAVAILVVLATSGFGLSERRREIGILKAIGWQTDEILLRSLVESLFLSLSGAALAILLSFVWLKWLNGFWIASVFLSGLDVMPSVQVPSRLAPVPVLLAVLVSFVVVLTGTLYSTWRAAIAAPVEAMR